MPSSVTKLENFINLTSLKGKVIARNIANVNTENYKREEVSFDEMLTEGMAGIMRKTNPQHMGDSVDEHFQDMNVKITQDQSMENNSGINNVNIDKEMSDLAENTILFKFASRKIGAHYRNLQNVIKGGRS